MAEKVQVVTLTVGRQTDHPLGYLCLHIFSSAICYVVTVLGGWERNSGAWPVRFLLQGPVKYQSLRGGG